MAIIDDNKYPHLTPPDDKLPSPGKMFRSPGDLTDEQFSLLAAAWAENALSDQSLAEIESLFASDPSKKAYADSFRQLRLNPFNERWEGHHTLLQTTPVTLFIQRAVTVTLAIAAIFISLLIFKPFAGKQVGITAPVSLPNITVASARIENTERVVSNMVSAPVVARTEILPAEKKDVPNIIVRDQTVNIIPVIMNSGAGMPVLTAGIDPQELSSVSFKNIQPAADISVNEVNWIIRGLSSLTRAITKEEKPINAYSIASTCIDGINSMLDWEMELDKTAGKDGSTVAVSFSSSLLSFSTPVNKSLQ